MENEMIAFFLKYLLENIFHSKENMARKLGVSKRSIQRAINQTASVKGTSMAFELAIGYCVEHHISFDSIIESYNWHTLPHDALSEKSAAYQNILWSVDSVPPQKEEMYRSSVRFIHLASLKLCPECRCWCNPWGCHVDIRKKECFLSFIARTLEKELLDDKKDGRYEYDSR